jgi:hypothetical protein
MGDPPTPGVALATKACALSAAMGAALNFKNCFIFSGSSHYPRRKKAMEFSVLPDRRWKCTAPRAHWSMIIIHSSKSMAPCDDPIAICSV